MRMRILWSVMLVMSMILAACGQDQITAENIVEKMREAQANTNDMHAVVALEFSSREESGSITAEYWTLKEAAANPDEQSQQSLRIEVLEASEAELQGVMAVFNGESGWFYEPQENVAIVGTAEDLKEFEENESSSGPTDQMDMLMELQPLIQQGLDAVDIEILGQEEIAGHNAYKLSITPKQETQAELQLPIELLVEITLWVDSERWMPLKLLVDAQDMGSLEITAQELEMNSNLDPALFAIDPPAGATIKTLDEIIAEMPEPAEQPATIDEAQAQVDFQLLQAGDETAGAALVDIQTMEMPQGTAVIQSYSGPSVEWSLVQSQGDMMGQREMSGNSTEVEVRGVTGSIIEGRSDTRTLLTWQAGDITYVLAGNISSEDALKLANSLK